MTTSGSYNYSITRADIFQEAYEIAQSLDPGETLSASDVAAANRKLNLMVKAWMAQGIHLWAVQEATLFMADDTISYSLGPTGTHCTASYVHTTLSTDEALGSTSIGITSATGMSASDNIGIVLDDGTIHWTTISGAPSTTTTIVSGLASAATAGNVVFAYTSKIQRPLRIIKDTIYRRNIDNNDTPVELISRSEYAQLSSKMSEGKPIQVFYEPTLTNGTLKVWLSPDSVTDVLRFSFERPIEDFDSTADNPDFPIEWGEAICYNLADRLSIGLGCSPVLRAQIKADAIDKLNIAMGFDREVAPMFFQPDLR